MRRMSRRKGQKRLLPFQGIAGPQEMLRTWAIFTLLTLVGLSWLPSSVQAQPYSFSPLDVPGSRHTYACSINGKGQIVGAFEKKVGKVKGHGFLYKQGKFTPLNVPGGTNTSATGINDAGQIVGSFVDNKRHGFLYTQGTFIPLDVPGSTSTAALGINAAGQIVGIYYDTKGSGGPRGFLYTQGTFLRVIYGGHSRVQPSDITDQGLIVGSFRDSAAMMWRGFLATP